MSTRPFSVRPAAGELFAVVGALLALALHAAGLGDALEYRRELLGAQPWRLVTGHFVHVSWPHVLVNAAAWLLLARWFAPEIGVRRQALVLAVSAPAIGLALALAWPQIGWYRGLSGVLHALYMAGAAGMLRAAQARRGEAGAHRAVVLAALLLAAGAIKVGVEVSQGALGAAAWLVDVPVATPAHLVGAVAGTACGFAPAAGRRRRRPHQAS